jgi:hypothetical protein
MFYRLFSLCYTEINPSHPVTDGHTNTRMRESPPWRGTAKYCAPIGPRLRMSNERSAASILKDGRVVFNVAGNKFRIVVWINYLSRVSEAIITLRSVLDVHELIKILRKVGASRMQQESREPPRDILKFLSVMGVSLRKGFS